VQVFGSFLYNINVRAGARENMKVVQNGKLLAWNFWKSFPKRKFVL
jgi:hypothetical protein